MRREADDPNLFARTVHDQIVANRDSEASHEQGKNPVPDGNIPEHPKHASSLNLRDYRAVPKDIVIRAWNHLRGAIPIPPEGFIYLVVGHRSAARFLSRGRVISETIRAVLAKNGVEIEQLNAILDFGCGVGRIMRHWESLQHPVLHGTDYNPLVVAWCQENIKFAKFQVNSITGNLSYESGKFDLIYSFSVFTHLSEPLQLFWIGELFRLLKPGGYLFFTTQGDHFLSQLSVAEQEKFRNGQLVVQSAEHAGSNVCTVYHPPTYVKETMAREFRVVDFLPGGSNSGLAQDVYLMKKFTAG